MSECSWLTLARYCECTYSPLMLSCAEPDGLYGLAVCDLLLLALPKPRVDVIDSERC